MSSRGKTAGSRFYGFFYTEIPRLNRGMTAQGDFGNNFYK
jgi:hypothetical protein